MNLDKGAAEPSLPASTSRPPYSRPEAEAGSTSISVITGPSNSVIVLTALEYMRPGDTLVVWRLSRLARSLKQIIETAHELEQKKQALKVLTRNIDTGTPEGRLFFHITAAFDEFQRELIVENTKAGLAAARKRGRRGGRPRVLDKEKIRFAEAMLKDTVNYPFVGDVIDHLRIGRTAFYRYFPPDRIRELRNHA